MAGEITVDSFLDLLGQSDLVSNAQLLALTSEFLSDGSRPDSPQTLAGELVRREILTPWQSEMLMQGKHRGFRLGPYRILRPLGQGGMSKVFLGEHEMMRRRSAIKILPSKYQEDKDLLHRFQLEARAAAALDHPNIVRAYDFNKDVRYGKEIHYLVMEYVEGNDLRRMIEEQGPLDYRKAADYICQAALGLAHAHAAGIVHRDIKPANLLVDPHGVLKILDLGLATVAFETEDSMSGEEGTQSAVGTADYVSPEQVIDSRNVDGRADIYSLGLTFYFLLTGHRPFSKPTIMEVLMAHRTERPEPISKSRPDVPLDLEAIIDKMTAKSPSQRYQTAQEVAETLKKWQNDSGSARTYSRLSALMAEAARAKQPSAHDTTPTVSASATTELDLKLAEDEPAASHGAKEKTASAESPQNKKPNGGEARKSGPLPKPAAALPVAEKLDDESLKGITANGTATTKKNSPSSKQKTAPAAMETDLLAGLLQDEIAADMPLGEGFPGMDAAPPLQPLATSTAKSSNRDKGLMQSPWMWIGVGVAVVVVVIVILLIAFGFSSTTSVNATVPSNVTVPTQQRTTPPAPTQPPPAAPPPTTAIEEKSPAASPQPPVAAVPEAKKAEEPPAAVVVQEKSPETPPPAPAEQKPVAPPVATPPAPIPPANNATNAEILLAGIQDLMVQLGQSIDQNPKSLMNTSAITQAEGAARQLDIKIVEKSQNVMEISFSSATQGNQFRISMSAELKCPDASGKTVTVWQKTEEILSGNESKMNLTQVMRVLRINVGKFADQFFEQFTKDVKNARKKVGK